MNEDTVLDYLNKAKIISESFSKEIMQIEKESIYFNVDSLIEIAKMLQAEHRQYQLERYWNIRLEQ